MRRCICLLFAVAGCAGEAADAPDAAATDPTGDDVVRYDLPVDCSGAPGWDASALFEPVSVVGFGTDEVWIVDRGIPGQGGALLRATRGDPGPTVLREGVTHVWACGPDDLWATGTGGLLLHWDGGALAEVPFPSQADLTSGVGCHGAVWISTDGGLYHLDGDRWTQLPFEVTDWPEFLPRDPIPGERIYRVGGALAPLGYYGEAFIERDDGRHQYVSTTDDINTDLFLRRDRTGFSLHGGYLLEFDGRVASSPDVAVEDVTAVRLSRRSDEDAWFVGDGVYHYDGAAFTREADHTLTAIDARATSVWAAGYRTLVYRSMSGWCTAAP